MKIEVGKKYITRDGKEATVNGFENVGYTPFHGFLQCIGRLTFCSWNENGFYINEIVKSEFDLISEVKDVD